MPLQEYNQVTTLIDADEDSTKQAGTPQNTYISPLPHKTRNCIYTCVWHVSSNFNGLNKLELSQPATLQVITQQ